ncbi:hypothetical protein [Fusobacterium polymorphum]|jgi:hypothetical protein|uniref:hypothetical protein n=1 Tax=Fusobacterium nucleatum subsp. polymorphum TaxID=76857 RepID=UPI003009CDE2
MSEEYGEIKVKKNIFPNDAKKIVEKGTIKILVTQNLVSSKTKKILTEGEVTLYEGVEPNEVNKIREKLKEKIREKMEYERGE